MKKNMHLEWSVHTPRLLKEIGSYNAETSATFRSPLRIFGGLLYQVGEEAARINDPALNALMCRLTIYACSDPESPEYDPELTKKVMDKEGTDRPRCNSCGKFIPYNGSDCHDCDGVQW